MQRVGWKCWDGDPRQCQREPGCSGVSATAPAGLKEGYRGMKPGALWLTSITVCLFQGASAQSPDPPLRFVQQTVESEPEGTEDAPRLLPETEVVGRPDSFPGRPLGDDRLLTPARSESSIARSGSSVTVIRAEEIRALGNPSLVEVLRRVVGLSIVQTGGPGRAAAVFIRGANSEHTKFLLDGIPLNDPSNATRSYDLSAFEVDNIERIEIVRGPQSLVYGSDAIGGVVNIVTKRGDGPARARLEIMGGSFGTVRESMEVHGGDDRVYYSASASYFQNKGISSVAPRFGGSERDGHESLTFAARIGWTPSEQLAVDYVFRLLNATTEIDDYLTDNLTRANHRKQLFQRIQIQSFWLDGEVEQKVGFSLSDFGLTDSDPGFFGIPEFLGQSRQVDWQSNLRLTDHNRFTIGFDYLQEEASSTVLAPQAQNLAGLYLQDEWVWGEFAATTIGVRWDESSVAGAAQTYRLTQNLRLEPTGAVLHGTLGEGFRVPAISQRFGFYGNPDLRPELSRGWDCGLRRPVVDQRVTLDATYFRNDFEDLIVFDTSLGGPTGFGALNNVGSARTSGVELVANVVLTDATDMTVYYTHLNTVNLDTQSRLLRRPDNRVGFSIHHRCRDDRTRLHLDYRYVGTRLDYDDQFSVTSLESYTLVNLSTTYQWSPNCELLARVDNLFDERYEEVFGFGSPGVGGFVGVRLFH